MPDTSNSPHSISWRAVPALPGLPGVRVPFQGCLTCQCPQHLVIFTVLVSPDRGR